MTGRAEEQFEVIPPGGRTQIRELAERARDMGARITRGLSGVERGWLEAAPAAAYATAISARPAFRDYYLIGDRARAAWRAAEAAGGASWMDTFARLVLCELIAAAPGERPHYRMTGPVWESAETGIEQLLQAIPEYHVGGEDDHDWLKDVSVAALRAFPYHGILQSAVIVRPLRYASMATMGERLALMRYLGPEFFRAGPWEIGHAWREFREIRRANPKAHRLLWRRSFSIPNTFLRGKLRTSWMADPQLETISPRHLERQLYHMRSGGVRIRVPLGEHTLENALAKSETRRRLYEEGKYVPRNYSIVIKRRDVIRELTEPELFEED